MNARRDGGFFDRSRKTKYKKSSKTIKKTYIGVWGLETGGRKKSCLNEREGKYFDQLKTSFVRLVLPKGKCPVCGAKSG